MATYEEQVNVHAGADEIWRVLYDVARWPTWTPTVRSASVQGSGHLAVGSRVRLKQPRLLPATWTITALEPGRSFDWQSSSPGLTSSAGHRIERTDDGCRVTLTFEQSGRGAALASLVYGRLIQRYVAVEAASLKRRAESGPDSPAS